MKGRIWCVINLLYWVLNKPLKYKAFSGTLCNLFGETNSVPHAPENSNTKFWNTTWRLLLKQHVQKYVNHDWLHLYIFWNMIEQCRQHLCRIRLALITSLNANCMNLFSIQVRSFCERSEICIGGKKVGLILIAFCCRWKESNPIRTIQRRFWCDMGCFLSNHSIHGMQRMTINAWIVHRWIVNRWIWYCEIA